MTDAPSPNLKYTTAPVSNKKAMQGFALLTVLTFILFVAAGLGWHAGVALAWVLGI